MALDIYNFSMHLNYLDIVRFQKYSILQSLSNQTLEVLQMYYGLKAEDIQQHAHTLVEFHGRFEDLFLSSTRSVTSHALDYLKEQLLLESRRNMA